MFAAMGVADDLALGSDHYLQRELVDRLANDPNLFAFLAHAATDGLWYWNLEHPDDEWMSPSFWQLFGIDPATKRHSPSEWQQLIHPADRDEALLNFKRHCDDPNYPYDQVVRYRHADGSTVWVRCRGMALRDVDGRPIRMLGTHTDVTRLKQAEHELEVKVARSEATSAGLRLANRHLENFSYILGHDLRAPLRAIMSAACFIREDAPPELLTPIEGYLDLLDEKAAMMARLIDDTLEHARATSETSDAAAIELRTLVDEAINAVGPRAGIDLRTRGDLEATVIVPDVPLSACLRNLIDNAIKHHPGPTGSVEVDVAVERDPGELTIAVIDDGAGIDPCNHELIFEPFKGLEDGSSGLGLASVKRIVDEAGGTVTLDSEAGSGATFTLVWPLTS